LGGFMLAYSACFGVILFSSLAGLAIRALL